MPEEPRAASQESLRDVLITPELARRPSRPPDDGAEARALEALGAAAAGDSHQALRGILEAAIQLCGAESSAFSVIVSEGAGRQCRVHVAAGALAAARTIDTLADASPCGHAIAEGGVQLFDRPGRYFPAAADIRPPIHECLIAPWDLDRHSGGLWAIAHSPERHFDAEDARLLAVLANFAAAVWARSAALADAQRERWRAAQRLYDTEARYRLLFETLDEGFVVAELIRDDAGRCVDWRFLEVNPALERLTGLKRASTLGRRAREVVPGLEDFWFEAYQHVADAGEVTRFEHYAQPLRRWYDVTAFPYGLDRVAILYDDITARKRTEEALRRSEARQAFLLRLGDELRPLGDPRDIQAQACRALLVYFAANRVSYVEIDEKGDSAAITIGASGPGGPETTTRVRISDYPGVARELRAGRSFAVPDVAAAERLGESERVAFAAEGVRSIVSVPLVKDGRLIAALSADCATPRTWDAEDIRLIEEVAERTWAAVERARAEAALRRSEERLRLVVESVADYAILTIDPSGALASWNTGAERTFGYSAKEAIGQPSDIIFTHEDRAAGVPAAEMRRAAETGRAEDERWHVNKEGRVFYVSGVLSPLHVHGRLLGYVKVARDMTERKQWEDELRRARDELEQRVHERTSELAQAIASLQAEVGERRAAEEQIKSLFKKLVSVQEEERRRVARDIHDQLGQQMTALRINLASLRGGLLGGKAFEDQLGRTEQLAEELDHSVDFLAWELRPPSLDHLGLAAALANLASGWSERFGVPVDCDAAGVEGLRLNPDAETNLYRVAQEALHNVYKHAGASHVHVFAGRRNGTVVLSIQDDGRGFAPHDVRRVAGKGGFGLVGMRERAIMAGGDLEVDSSPGHGTTVRVRVPIPD